MDVAEGDERIFGLAGDVVQAEKSHDGDRVKLDAELLLRAVKQAWEGAAHRRILGDGPVLDLGHDAAAVPSSGTLGTGVAIRAHARTFSAARYADASILARGRLSAGLGAAGALLGNSDKEDGKEDREDHEDEEHDAEYNEPLSRHPTTSSLGALSIGTVLVRAQRLDIAQVRPSEENRP